MSVHAVVGHQFEDDTTPRRKAQPPTDDLVTSMGEVGKWCTYILKLYLLWLEVFWYNIHHTWRSWYNGAVFFVFVGRKSSKKVTTTLCKKTSKSSHPSPGLLDVPFGFINAGVRSLVKKLHLKSRGEVGSWNAAGYLMSGKNQNHWTLQKRGVWICIH